MLNIGGDGTILWAMTISSTWQIPSSESPFGRLGFLATISQEEITDMFAKIRAGRFHTDERSAVLQITHTDGRPIAPLNFALNEITVIRQNSTAMITVEAYLNDQYLTSYWADGLIIATPTGSTGYSSYCGACDHAAFQNLGSHPIAPHNLNARPLIIPDSTEITLHVSNREGCYLATYDARSAILPCETSVKISLAPFHLKTIELEGNDLFKTLRTSSSGERISATK